MRSGTLSRRSWVVSLVNAAARLMRLLSSRSGEDVKWAGLGALGDVRGHCALSRGLWRTLWKDGLLVGDQYVVEEQHG